MEPIISSTSSSSTKEIEILYSIDNAPPWYLTILLGLQHFLTMIGAAVAVPFLLAPSLCMAADSPARANIISTILFVSGIVTFLQTTFGVRLPILQGGTFTLLVPTFAILNLPQWKCPKGMMESSNITLYSHRERENAWKSRIAEVQGAILLAGVFEMLLAVTGVIGLLLRFITPLVIAPVIALVGLGLVESSANLMSGNWIVALVTAVLIVIFAVYMKNVHILMPVYKSKSCQLRKVPFFQLFPVLLTLLIMYIICLILTQTNALPPEDGARTDLNLNIIHLSEIFSFPYPFQWGIPTFSVSAGLGMIGGILASVVESIGDYYACAKLSGAPAPPIHAINRGICMEGFGTIIAGLLGTGNGTTSYSENVGVIGITKVGSRRVLQAVSIILIFFGLFCKFGAFFVTIPSPIVGGIFLITFAFITATGLSQIQYINLNSSRNLMVLGIPLFCGLVIPKWIEKNRDAINTGNEQVDNSLQVLFGTSMFVGGLLAILLDNTLPGGKEDRGLTKWGDAITPTGAPAYTYNFPCGMSLITRSICTKFIPICPTFESCICPCVCPCIRKTMPPSPSIENEL